MVGPVVVEGSLQLRKPHVEAAAQAGGCLHATTAPKDLRGRGDSGSATPCHLSSHAIFSFQALQNAKYFCLGHGRCSFHWAVFAFYSGRNAGILTVCFAKIVGISYINMTTSADIDPLLIGGTPSQLEPEKASSFLAKLWAETRNEVRHDLKSTRWRHTAASFFTWLGFSVWALGLIILCIIFPLVITHTMSLESSEYWNYCAPDGSFSLEPTNAWSPDWTFQIVLAFGSLSFTQAKVVDIVWDIVSSANFQSHLSSGLVN